MGTPELDSRLAGLQSYLASTKGSDQESSEIYKEACWQVDLLQQYSSISEQFRSIFVYEGRNSRTPQGSSVQVGEVSFTPGDTYLLTMQGISIHFNRYRPWRFD